MGMYHKIKFMTGKVTALIMAVIFPFAVIIRNGKIREINCYIFSAFSVLVLLCAVINRLINNKEKFRDFRLSEIKSRYIVTGVLLIIAVLWNFISPSAGYELSGAGSIMQGTLFFAGCACIYIVISECYIYEEADMMAMLTASIIINVITLYKFFASAKSGTDAYVIYSVMMLAASVHAFLLSEDNKKIYYFITAGFCEAGLILTSGYMAFAGMWIVFLVMLPAALRKYECFARYELVVLMIFLLGRLYAYINAFTGKVNVSSDISAFLMSNKTSAIIAAGCIIYMLLIMFDERIKGFIKNIRKDIAKCIYAGVCGLAVTVVLAIVMINNYRYNYTFYLNVFMGIVQIAASVVMFVIVVHKVLEAIDDRNKPDKDINYGDDDSLLQGYGSRYMITATGMAALVYILLGTGNLFRIETFSVFICFVAIMNTYNKNCGS